MSTQSRPEPRPAGFDAAVKRREEDYLNRWPFAREIYGIATTGPIEWSVRVGIYGEWGTGKSSVLEFIGSMAERDGHIVVRFNPWIYINKEVLWREFVLAMYNEPHFVNTADAKRVRVKKKAAEFWKGTKLAEAGAGLVSDKAGKALGAGLDLVKTTFSFSKADLASLHANLGEKRVIVLVDDLDRTGPELVPEILFALKELTDIPQFSFICAFDPVVVGEVLGRHHPGFGDGLKFLEKIIDYPRWLPPADADALANLAVANSKKFCPFVPEPALRGATALLPPNPRAIRQFIRLLALVGPQVQRHGEEELRWPVILAANVIKIRQPQLARFLLKDEAFWRTIEGVSILSKEQEREEQVNKALTDHVDSKLKSRNVSLSVVERSELLAAMKQLCSKFNILIGGGAEALVYQMDVAESPAAVTRKEFLSCFDNWSRKDTRTSLDVWITEHSNKVEHERSQVYTELLEKSLKHYTDILRDSDSATTGEERKMLTQQAESLIAFLECLILDVGLAQPNGAIDETALSLIIDRFVSLLEPDSPVLSSFCERNEALMLRLIRNWKGDAAPLIAAISPYGAFVAIRMKGKRARALHVRLSAAVVPKLVQHVIANFNQDGFLDCVWRMDQDAFQIRSVFIAPDSLLWSNYRTEFLTILEGANRDQNVQKNAYELLLWFANLLREGVRDDVENVKKLLSDKNALDAIWAAALAAPLSPPATFRLAAAIKGREVLQPGFQFPNWWNENIKAATLPRVSPHEEAG